MAEVASKVVVYATLLLLVGVSCVRWSLLGRAGIAEGSTFDTLRRISVIGWTTMSVGLVFRAWAHTAAVFGTADSLSYDAMKTVVIDSRWGEAWRWQGMWAVAGLALALWPRPSRLVSTAGAAVALGAIAALTRMGHAEGIPWRMALHSAHVAGGGVWLGTLAVVAAIGCKQVTERNRLLEAFSTVAIVGFLAVGATGAVAAYVYLGSIGNVWTTGYGRALVVKLACVAGALACGFINWRSMRASTAVRIAPALMWELVLAMAIVIATGVVTELEHP